MPCAVTTVLRCTSCAPAGRIPRRPDLQVPRQRSHQRLAVAGTSGHAGERVRTGEQSDASVRSSANRSGPVRRTAHRRSDEGVVVEPADQRASGRPAHASTRGRKGGPGQKPEETRVSPASRCKATISARSTSRCASTTRGGCRPRSTSLVAATSASSAIQAMQVGPDLRATSIASGVRVLEILPSRTMPRTRVPA
jgi:hypothetical protein